MMTFVEIEERAQKVHDRMAAIVKEMARISVEGDIDKTAIVLLDEMMGLAKESQNIRLCLEQQNYLAEQLINARCSGPH